MNIFQRYKSLILTKALQLYPALPHDIVFSVESPKDNSHGDIASNIALIASKKVGIPPLEIAKAIASELLAQQDIIKAEIAAPGFINLSIASSAWHEELHNILFSGKSYGNSDIGKGALVNLEFVSCNPTGPMHIGHARGAVFGDALARIMTKTGFKVHKEFYINDAGNQIKTLIQSAHARYMQAIGQYVEIPEGCYPGEYLIPVGKDLAEVFGDSLKNLNLSEVVIRTRDFVLSKMLDLIKADLALLGVYHDKFVSEQSELHDVGLLQDALDHLSEKGLVYNGVLEAPKGKTIEDWEPQPQSIFKSTAFGDDVDRVVVKSNGEYTYFVGDIAYHYNKIERGFKDMILILGSDHIGYVKRITAAVNAIDDKARIDIKITQLVNLLKNGQPYKMSKRSGNFVTVKDMVEELGADIIRFMMLTRKGDTVLDLDFALAKEESKDNPIFYVQYAYARASSILRKNQNKSLDFSKIDLGCIASKEELQLIQKMAQWPKVLEVAAQLHEPHRVTYYLYELATQFHSLWTGGSSGEKIRFVVEGDMRLTDARMGLAQAVQNTLASGFDAIGVTPMERM
jgi:arginyl-tRNA synthetase